MSNKNWLILPDVHRPFHNKFLWDKIINLISDVNPYGLVITGDYLDLYSLASFNDKSLERLKDITLFDEYNDGEEGLRHLEDAHKFEEKVFIFGNHEDRYFRFMGKGDNAKINGAITNPVDALGLKNKGYQIVQDWKRGYHQIGKMQVFHGYYTNLYAARKHMDTYHSSCIFGHTHRMQTYSNRKYASYNIGWLGDIEAEAFLYADRGQKETWVNGFAFLTVNDAGNFWVEMIQCHNDSFMYGGKFY